MIPRNEKNFKPKSKITYNNTKGKVWLTSRAKNRFNVFIHIYVKYHNHATTLIIVSVRVKSSKRNQVTALFIKLISYYLQGGEGGGKRGREGKVSARKRDRERDREREIEREIDR